MKIKDKLLKLDKFYFGFMIECTEEEGEKYRIYPVEKYLGYNLATYIWDIDNDCFPTNGKTSKKQLHNICDIFGPLMYDRVSYYLSIRYHST